MSTNRYGLTSDNILLAPFSEHELREQWNAQADVDEFNHWDNLGLDEQLAWAQTRAIAADRAQGGPRDRPPVAESEPTPAAAEPLWRVMVRAYNNAPELPDGIKDREMWAAEIVAARNWLKRRLPEGGAWYVLLTTEADRAERGE